MRLLLDEHIAPRVARLLRERGHDAIAVAERHDLVGQPDAVLFHRAIEEGRSIVTENGRDFLLSAAEAAARAERHPGLVVLSPHAGLRQAAAIGRLAAALGRLLEDEPGGLDDRVVWLDGTP